MKRLLALLPLLTLTLLSACATPTPPPSNPIRPNVQAKALATIAPSITPVVPPTATDDGSRPTPTGQPGTLTPSPTPLLGTFMGLQTFPAVESTFTWVPTRGPKIIILTARPGTRTPSAGAVLVPVGAAIPPPFVSAGSPIPVVAGTPIVCGVPVASAMNGAFAKTPTVGARIGCPKDGGYGLTLVIQPFQNGVMIWRESKEIYALGVGNAFYKVSDTWNETLPANDPALNPPAGLAQPVRGFGYVWRNNPSIRNGLGWALSGEQRVDGYWQEFERGFMIAAANGDVYALAPVDSNGGQHFGGLKN